MFSLSESWFKQKKSNLNLPIETERQKKSDGSFLL